MCIFYFIFLIQHNIQLGFTWCTHKDFYTTTDLFGDCLCFPSVNFCLLFNKKQSNAPITIKTKQTSTWNPKRNSSRTSFALLSQLQSQMLRGVLSSSALSGSRIKSAVAVSSNQIDVDFGLYPGIVAITTADCLSPYQEYWNWRKYLFALILLAVGKVIIEMLSFVLWYVWAFHTFAISKRFLFQEKNF